MSIKRSVFNLAASCLFKIVRLNEATALSCAIAEKVNPIAKIKHNGTTYVLCCPNLITRWRAETFLLKEPETISWIKTFAKGDILFDIGANVGLYSIFAGKNGIKVIAFEPESQNYALLNKNIFANNLSSEVTAFNIALANTTKTDHLFIPEFQAGQALNTFGEACDWTGKPFIARFRQGVVSFSLDEFVSLQKTAFPTHLKIDVDGLEGTIIEGASKTLRDFRLKSLLVELNDEDERHRFIPGFLAEAGWKLCEKVHSPMFNCGPYACNFNWIFRRNG